MILAEKLLLCLTDDDTGTLVVPTGHADVGLGGAILVELVLRGRVGVAGPQEDVKEGRLLVRDPSPTGDALLDAALTTVGRKQRRDAATLGRPAMRTEPVTAQPERCHAGGHGDRVSAAGGTGVWSASHGLTVAPYSSLSQCQRTAMVARLLRPTGIAPAARSRSTSGALADGPRRRTPAPCVADVPARSMESLTMNGTPRSGGRSVLRGGRAAPRVTHSRPCSRIRGRAPGRR
jgi:hypothetical protein